jgi:hypothetical protein
MKLRNTAKKDWFAVRLSEEHQDRRLGNWFNSRLQERRHPPPLETSAMEKTTSTETISLPRRLFWVRQMFFNVWDYGVRPYFIAALAQVKSVFVENVVSLRAVFIKERFVNVFEEDGFIIGEYSDKGVDFVVFLTPQVCCGFSSGKNCHQDYFHRWFTGFDFLNDGFDTGGYGGWRNTAVGVIVFHGAYGEDDDFGVALPVKVPVLDAVEDVFNAVAGNAKVNCFERSKLRFPDGRAARWECPRVREGVAEEEDVVAAFFGEVVVLPESELPARIVFRDRFGDIGGVRGNGGEKEEHAGGEGGDD